MLLTLLAATEQQKKHHRHRFTQGEETAFAIQSGEVGMGYIKESWTEEGLLNLPVGEQNYLERKSGLLFGDRQALSNELSEVLSAMANSGGGHIILGQANDGTIDGVPRIYPVRVGRNPSTTPCSEWLNQVIPTFVKYPLEAFRVHEVQRRQNNSEIPADKEVIVIDVGDSRLAPHQAAFPANAPQYYYREGNRSVLAPHHYLELLRNRLTAAVVEPNLRGITVTQVGKLEPGRCVAVLQLSFELKNTSRIACYEWQMPYRCHSSDSCLVSFEESKAFKMGFDGINLQKTILPTISFTHRIKLAVKWQLGIPIERQVREMLPNLRLLCWVVTENHIGEEKEFRLDSVISADELIASLKRLLKEAKIDFSWRDE